MVYGEPVDTVRTVNEHGGFAQTVQHAAPEQLVSALSTTTRSPTATVETIAHVEPTNDPALPADAVPGVKINAPPQTPELNVPLVVCVTEAIGTDAGLLRVNFFWA